MKNLDWQLLLFVGTSIAHEFWIYWGLPQIYYYDIKREYLKNKNDNDKAA